MQIIITGGLGFIGKTLCKQLLAAGHEVTIFDAGEGTKLDPQYHEGAAFISGDVLDPAAWSALPAADYLYHFAAPSSIMLFQQQKNRCVQITLQGLMNAFQWAETHQLKKLIYPSSGSIFGPQKAACDEQTVPHPANTYGKTKLACEYLAQIYADTVPSLGLRIFAGYGPSELEKGPVASVVTLFLTALQKGESPVIFGDGSQTRDFVYIDDVVETLEKSLTTERVGVLNVGSGEATSFKAVAETLAKKLGISLRPSYVDRPTSYLESTLCDPTELIKLLGRKPLRFAEGVDRYFATMPQSGTRK